MCYCEFMNYDIASQILLSVLSGLGIFILSRPEKWNKWGFVFGVFSQPFWLYTILYHNQYYMIPIELWFTFAYAQGVYYRFIKHGR